MDTLSPELFWVDGCCYRLMEIIDSVTSSYREDTDVNICEDNTCPDDIDEFEIEAAPNDRFKTSFSVPKLFYCHIIGTKGLTKKRIEVETKTQIKIPWHGQNGPIVIIGPTEQCVVNARRRIDLIVIGAREKHWFTHFVSIPFIGDDVKENFLKLKTMILEDKSRNIDEVIFQKENKLHMTIGILTLIDEDDISRASQALLDCKKFIIDPFVQKNGALSLKLSGLQYMNDDPTAVDVLYGEVADEHETDIGNGIQSLCDDIMRFFVKKGLMKKEYETLKLHVTLMNSKFHARGTGPSRKTFDVTEIMDKYKTFNFGSQKLAQIHLSQLGLFGADGYYEPAAVVDCS